MNVDLVPLKYLVAINPEVLPEDTDPDLEIRYVDIGSVGRGMMLDSPEVMTFGVAPSRARRVVRLGDVIISTVRTYLRAVLPIGQNEDGLVVSTGFAVIRPRILDRGYATWLMQSDLLVEEVVARSVGVSYPAINAPELGTIRVPVPSIPHQRAIAAFLDRETTAIGAMMSNQRRLVSLLNERIDALIKIQIGLSAIAAPASGRTVPLKRILRKVMRPFEPGSPVVTAYRDGEVNARANRRAEGYTLASDESTYQGVTRGDVVIHGLDGFSGAIGECRVEGCCSPVYHVCEVIDKNFSAYIARMLRILALDGYIGAHATSVRERAVDLRNWALVGAIPVPIVAPDEQARVVGLIDRALAISEATTRIYSKLQERRQAVITAVITGQMHMSALPAE